LRHILTVERAFDGKSAALKHVGIDHSRLDVLVPEEFLNGPYVVAVFEEMGGETMVEGMVEGMW